MSIKISAFSFFIVLVFGVIVAAVYADETQDVIKSINDLDSETSLYLFGGLSVERLNGVTSGPIIAGPRSGAAENIVDRIQRYMESHEIKFSMTDAITDDDSQVQEARSGRLKKILLPLLLAFKLKWAVVLPIVLKAIALISIKGLIAGTLALIFSGATFVKDLLAKKQERITTAYISGGANPINAELIHHGGDWNRNGQAGPPSAQELAYNYHTIPQY